MPPDRRGGAPTGSARHHQRQSLAKEDQHRQSNGTRRQCGLYASGWRDGFTAGAVDALPQAGRRLPIEAWHVLEQLADEYELAR
ncbi:MAG: hypothetical protein ACLP9Y_00020 [Mycobacterium sp.]